MEYSANASGRGPDVFAAFGEAFLSEYLSKGFGTMSKREIELLVLRTMLESKSTEEIDRILLDVDEAALSKELRIRTTRVHNMITDLRYRYRPTDETLRTILKANLSCGEHDDKTGLIRVQIANELVREYAKAVATNHGIVDRRLDGSIIEMNPSTFIALSLEIMSEQFNAQVFRKIPKKVLKEKTAPQQVVSEIVKFVTKNATEQAVRASMIEIFHSLKDGIEFTQLLTLAKSVLGQA
jgi:hypothetical protein